MANPIELPQPPLPPTQTHASGGPREITTVPPRQLSVRKAALTRAADHAAALSGDLRDWVELRIELVKTEISEKVADVKTLAKRKAVSVGMLAAAGVLGLYAFGFLLSAASEGLATLLGHPAWGDLVVGGSLLLLVLVLVLIASRRLKKDKAIEATLKPKGTSTP